VSRSKDSASTTYLVRDAETHLHMNGVTGRIAVVAIAVASLVIVRPCVASAIGNKLVLTPDHARPGATISFSGSGWSTNYPRCEVIVDGARHAGACEISGSGHLSGSFTVPDHRPGGIHVMVCQPDCNSPKELIGQEETELRIPETVPDVRGMRLAQATRVLWNKHLKARPIGNLPASDNAVVDTQSPVPGSDAPESGVVDVTLVDVPRPSPSTSPPSPSSAPSPSVAPPRPRPTPTEPEVLVIVPNLTGMTAAEAATTLRQTGLVLQPPTATVGVVAAQSPAPGTHVPRGTTITVRLESSPSQPSPPSPQPSIPPQPVADRATRLVPVLLAVTGLGAVLTARLRRRLRTRQPPTLTGRIHGVPYVDAAGSTSLTGPARTRSVRLEPHHDHGTTTIEETPR
jgi:hypothetical protein